MFLTARMGSGLVIGRLPDDHDDGEQAGSGGSKEGGNDDHGSGDDDAHYRPPKGRGRPSGLPRWSAPSAIACSGFGYGFQAGCEVRVCAGVYFA